MDNEFIVLIVKTRASLSSIQENSLSKIEKSKIRKFISFIQLNDLTKIQKEGILDLNIPSLLRKLKAKATHVETDALGNYTWHGDIKEEGSINIVKRGNKIHAYISTQDEAFEIQPLGDEDGLHILTQVDKEQIKNLKCGVNGDKSLNSVIKNKTFQAQNTSTVGNCIVRVMVLYTAKARNAVPDIVGTAELALAQVNEAFRRSLINPLQVVFSSTVSQTGFTKGTPFPDIGDDVQRLKNDAFIKSLRDLNNADLVVLLTDGNYETALGRVAEIGPNNSAAYAIVQANKAVTNYTFVHELGHLFGGRHENDPTPGEAHSYTFKTGIWPFRKTNCTVMYQFNDNNVIQNFSNPNVTYKGISTGKVGTNDNANVLRNTASEVAAFRGSAGTLVVAIIGSIYVDPGFSDSWGADLSGGIEPYQYEWRTSTDGMNYGGVVGTNSIYSQVMPNSDLYLWLNVRSADGQVKNVYKHVQPTSSCELCISGKNSLSLEASEQKSSKTLQIFPNPITDNAEIHFKVEETGYIRLSLFNLNGIEKLIYMEGQYQKGQYIKQINTAQLVPGLYFVLLRSLKQLKVEKIMVQR